MSHSLQAGHSLVVSAFHTDLVQQLLGVLLVLVALVVVRNFIRTTKYSRAGAAADSVQGLLSPEPVARRVLRIGFGLLWLFNGLLQIQASMPLGMAPGVLRPAASSSPSWVQHVVNVAVTIWANHPLTVATAIVWIEVGIGLLLLVAPRGGWSQASGVVSVGWGLIVWVFGEAFGGLFAPGLTWAFGAPGAALIYVVAGGLIALPERWWRTPKLGERIVSIVGAFFVVMAVLQAWPGRGFWQGNSHGSTSAGTLASMIRVMAKTPQPGFLSSWVSAFGSFDATHGWGVNLFLVVALAGIGIGLLSRHPSLVRWAVIGAGLVCLADWVLVQDLGFLGGVGTDANSMIPMMLVFVAGYLAIVRLPVTARAATDKPLVTSHAGGRERGGLNPIYAFRAFAAVGATALVLFGAAPVALASTNPNADPILAEEFDGPPSTTNAQASPFDLVDQHNRPVSLASLHGKTVALTFLDPVCTSDCPLIAREFRQADALLGGEARHVDFIAIVANPIYRSTAYTVAFDRQEGLSDVPNWLFLTGSVQALHSVWNAYGAEVYTVPAGSMVAHAELTFVINGHGRTRVIMGEDQDPANTPQSSFSVLLANEIKGVLAS
jgi:cytochrome oxidase Cu insertion factor (SCO1/SenC/PrrC family)